MLLKIIGITVLIITGTLMGFSLCEDYIERIHCLECLKKALLILRGEIKHNNSSICEALENIDVGSKNVMKFFRGVVREYKYKKISLWEAWDNSVTDYLKKESCLSKEEIKIIKDFGRNLGITDRETQLKNIDECVKEIEVSVAGLKKEKKEKCKLYKTLGILSGLFISIIFL